MEPNHLNDDISKSTSVYPFSDISYSESPQYINYIPSVSSKTSQNIPKDILEDIFEKVCFDVSGYNEPDDSECSSIAASSETISPLPTPDCRLVNWETWLKNREKQIENITKKTNKNPCDVLMNRSEKIREKCERKYILDYSKVHFDEDKKRGGDPVFWKIPPKLKSINNLGDCFMTFTTSELSNKPLITYTETPRIILQEKNVVCPEHKTSWLHSEYLQQKMIECCPEISSIEPYVPQREELGLKGKQMTLNDPLKISSDDIIIYESITEESVEEELSLQIAKKCILCINDKNFNVAEKSNESCCLYFHFNELVNVRKTIEIIFQNCGEITIEFEWHQEVITLINHKIIKTRHQPVFFFNKNKFRLIPNEVMTLPIYFYCDADGIFTEKWLLKTNPDFFNDSYNLRVNLWANCTLTNSLNNWEAVEKKIKHRAAAYASSKLLYSIVGTLGPEHQPNHYYKRHFLEEDLFQQNNPDLFFYHQNVSNLKKLFQKTTNEQGDCFDWNYDMCDLRKRILSVNDEKLRKQYFETYQKNLNYLIKPNYVVKSSGEHKYSLVRSTIMSMLDEIANDAEELKKRILSPVHDLTFDETVIRKAKTLNKRSLVNIQSLTDSMISEDSLNSEENSLLVIKSENIRKKKYEMYIESLYVKVYHHLSGTIEEIACLLSSLSIVSSNY